MIIILSILVALIFSALVLGQMRLIQRSIASGEIGWGRYAAVKESQPVRYYLWLAVYVLLLLYAASLVFGAALAIIQVVSL